MGNEGELEYRHGWTNQCTDGKQVIFLDFDEKFNKIYLMNLNRMQKFFSLSDFYILETDKGFHAVCIDKFERDECLKIIKNSGCDRKFYELGKQRKSYTLRLSKKINYPKFKCVLSSIYQHREKSKPHFLILKTLAKFEKIALFNPDYLDKKRNITLCSYGV